MYFSRLLPLVGLALLASVSAQATVLVHVVQNDPTANDASQVPSSTLPSADFNSPNINFNVTDSTSFSLATFFNNPTFFNQQNGFDPTKPTNNTFLEITGQTFLKAGTNSFVVGHDDGVVLTFATLGNVVNQPGPTGFTDTPFNVTAPSSGLFSFDLKYTECCGGPANLVFDINGAPVGNVPEPASLVLLSTGVLGLALTLRYRRG